HVVEELDVRTHRELVDLLQAEGRFVELAERGGVRTADSRRVQRDTGVRRRKQHCGARAGHDLRNDIHRRISPPKWMMERDHNSKLAAGSSRDANVSDRGA